MAVVGVAEILVRPSFKGFQSEIGQMVDSATPEKGPGSPGGEMAGRIAKGLKWAGTAALTGSGVVLGTALTKGFGRLQAIENAQAKLTGLGHDAGTVEGIMRDATAAVKGTAFGLGDAATASAAAVAAGVQPGQELQDVLTLMGDAATIAGTDFGSMATIFNKVKASGKLQGDEILQLSEAGIPILQFLAAELGVTAGEVSEMASKGQIDFATFASAMEAGLGGAAQSSGDTLQGAFANSMAAIGRFGANLMSSVYPQVRTFFAGFIEWMGPVEELGKVIGERLGQALAAAVQQMISFGGWVRDNAAWLSVLGAAVGTIAAGIAVYVGVVKAVTLAKQAWAAAQLALNAVMSANPIGIVIIAVAALVAAAVAAYQHFEWFRQVVDGAWNGIKAAAQAAWEGVLRPVFEAIGGWITGALVPAFMNFWQGVIVPAWAGISAAISAAWTGFILPALQGFGQWITGTLGPAIVNFWQTVVVPAWQAIGAIIRGAWEGHILPVFTFLHQWVTTFLMPLFTELWQSHVVPAWAGIAAAVQQGWEVIGPALGQIVEGVGRVVSAITSFLAPAFQFLAPIVGTLANILGVVLGGAFTLAVQFVGMLVGALIDHLGGAVQGAIQFISGLVQFVAAIFQGDWRAAWEGMKNMAVGAFQFLWHAINVVLTVNILGVVRSGLASMLGLFRSGMSGITGLFRAAWNGIVSLIRGAWNGIVSIARGGASGLSSIVNGLINAILGFFRSMGSGMTSIIRNAWSTARSAFSAATAAIRALVSQFVSAVVGFFRNLGTKIASHSSSMMSKAWGLFRTGMGRLKTAVSDGVRGVLTYFREMPQKVVAALGNLGNTLKESGRALLGGFMDGIKDGFSRAKGAIEDGLGGLRNLFPFSPAKEGPFSGRGYTTYSGRALSRDFADAIAGEADYLAARGRDFVEAADFTATPTVTPGALAAMQASLSWGVAGVAPRVDRAAGTTAGQQYPSHLTLVLEDGTAFPAYLAQRTDARIRHHVNGLAQPLRQHAGA